MFDTKFSIGETDKAGPRNVTVKGPDWKIEGPDRVLTCTDIRASRDVMKAPIQEFEFPHDIIEIRKEFDALRLNKFTRFNSKFLQELRIIRQYGGRYNTTDRFVYFRVIRKPDARITSAQNRALMHAEFEDDFPIITIHEDCRMASADNLDKRLEESTKYIEGFRDTKLHNPFIEPMVIISARCEDSYEFYRKLVMAKKHGIVLFCIENGRSINAYYNNYIKLKEFVAKNPEVFIIGANTEKVIRGTGMASGPHIMNLFGQDAAGLSMPQSFNGDNEENYSIPRFERATGGVLPRKNQEEMFGERLNCSCPVCLHKSRSQFYNYARTGQLPSATKVHEAFESRELFNETKSNMGDMKIFLPQKQHLVEGLSSLGLNFNKRQRGLKDFN